MKSTTTRLHAAIDPDSQNQQQEENPVSGPNARGATRPLAEDAALAARLQEDIKIISFFSHIGLITQAIHENRRNNRRFKRQV